MTDVIGVRCAMAAQSVLATAALESQAHANVHLDGRIYLLAGAPTSPRSKHIANAGKQFGRQTARKRKTQKNLRKQRKLLQSKTGFPAHFLPPTDTQEIAL